MHPNLIFIFVSLISLTWGKTTTEICYVILHCLGPTKRSSADEELERKDCLVTVHTFADFSDILVKINASTHSSMEMVNLLKK